MMKKTYHIDVSVIIVNYYSLSEVRECIKSLLAYTSPKITCEIIVVSNSPEESEEINALKKLTDSITFHSTEYNLGFARANNIGAKLAKGKYFFFLNPDTLLLNNALELLYQKAEEKEELGLLAPCMMNDQKKEYPSVRSDINTLTLLSLAIPFGTYLFSDKYSHEFYLPKKSTHVDVVQGSAMFISSELFHSVEGMNEDFFMYSEERDLCLKVRKKGYTVFYYKEAKVQHTGGATTSKIFLKMEIEKHRSKKTFIVLHYPQLKSLNRICGVIGYSWRSLGALLTFQKNKFRQFSTIFYWYAFKYR